MNNENLVFQSHFTSISILDILLVILSLILIILIMFELTKGKIKNFIVSILVILFSISLYDIFCHFSDTNYLKNVFKNGSYYIVEGKIENFHAMPTSGHDTESFEVNNIHFEISYTGNYPDSETLFYTLTKNRNGPIYRNGQKVKIFFVKDKHPTFCIPWTKKCITFNTGKENKIIKLWVFD